MMNGESIFNTHAEHVDVAPATAWATFLDRTLWMESFGARRLVSDVDEVVGAIADVTMAVAGSPVRQEETLLFDAPRRLVVRVTAAGTAMAAHADFQFDPAGDGCRIQVSIHSWMPGHGADERRHMQDMTQAKIASDFGRLRDVLHAAR